MDTQKISIKKLHKQGRGSTIFISLREREHIEVRKTERLVIDTSIPDVIQIMSIKTWEKRSRIKDEEL